MSVRDGYAEDIRDLFVPNFYFGCEADDPINAMAFDTRKLPFGAKLNAIFSSDIGHWDVPDMTEVTRGSLRDGRARTHRGR